MKSVNAVRMCFSPKVIGTLAVVAGLIFVLAPDLMFPALPLLLLAACPLSMLLMVLMMRGDHDHQARTSVPDPDGPDEVAALRAELASLRERLDETNEASLRQERRHASGKDS
jgi:Protein of unknown function (DUF2933)